MFLILFIGARYFFNNHKQELISQIEKTLNEKSNGEIIFDSITLSSFKEFPSLNFTIYNLTLVDSLYVQHKRKTVHLQEVSAYLSVIDILNEEVKIKSVSAKKGHINIFVDEDHYTNSYLFTINPKNKENSLNLKVIDNDVAVLIEDIEFTFNERIKNSRITSHINKIDFNIDLKKLIIPKLYLDIFMKEMGLNLGNGTFFNNVRCVGSFQPNIDTSNKTVEVPEFSLKIGKQNFDITAFINLKNKGFKFLISSEETNYNKSLHLLPDNIKSNLTRYYLKNTFKIKADISGRFIYKNNTLVKLKYTTSNNEILLKKDSLLFKNISFNGSFINRIYDDSTKIENRKNFTKAFDTISGEYNNIPFKINHLTLVNEFSKPIYLTTTYEAEGEVRYINDFINSPDFKFSNGIFNLSGKYNGSINSITDIIKSSKTLIKSNGLVISSKHNSYNIPILKLYIDHNNAEIKKLIVYLNKKERILITGDIRNFNTLLSNEMTNESIFSTINISSTYLNYKSLQKLFGAKEKHSQSINLSHIKQSINLLANKFNPSFNFSLQQLDFFDVPYNTIYINANYKKNQVFIKEIRGNYKGGNASAKIDVDLNSRINIENKETLKLDLLLKATGEIEHWAEILNNKKFFLKNANYKLNVSFNNEASNLTDLIKNSDITLNVNEGSVLYKPVNLTLPFNNISLNIKNNTAFLNDFELKLPNNQSLHLKGEIDNFMEVFDNSVSTNNVTSSITISSKRLNFSNFIDTFNPISQKSTKQNNVKIILNELYSKFKPTLALDLKKLSYNNVTLENVNAALFFKDINTLILNNAYCFYYQKKMSINAEFDISEKAQTPFKTNFSIDDFAIENLLNTFSNFGFAQLEDPTKITGIIKIESQFRGVIDDTKGVIYDSLMADLNFEVKKLNVNNFKPIVDAGKILFRKKRLEEIMFANISSSLHLKNNIISIPETNVQSTAFDFFIEGDIAKSLFTDLWVSIPLSNIKKRDLTKAPSKKSFDKAGKKIYLEIKSKEEGELEYKLHLNEKKYKKSSN